MKQCRDAALNYIILAQSLWPCDYGPTVIFKVFDDSNWGEELGSEAKRVAAIKRAFDDFAKENAGRAIRRQPPLEYEALYAR